MLMDSFNSSSGGDNEEYNSRPALAGACPGPIPFSSLLMNSNAPQLLHHHYDNMTPPPLPVSVALPNFFDQLTRLGPPDRNHQPLFQLDVGMGGDDLGVMLPPSESSPSANLTTALQLSADLGSCPRQSQTTARSSTHGVMNPSCALVSDPPKPVEDCPLGRNNISNGMPPRRNPKKRTRVSRRAPMTVLTTDVSNFQAMVQEFTGIPAPPFDAEASLFQRGRFDLFGTNFSGNATGTGSSIPSSSPSYLLRPFAQRLLQAFPLPPTSLIIPPTMNGDNTSSASAELLFPLLRDNNNVNGPNDASPSMLELGQMLVKHTSNHDQERAQERLPQGNLRQGGIDNVLQDCGLGRQGDCYRDRDFTAMPSSTQNVAIANRGEGRLTKESWICSSD